MLFIYFPIWEAAFLTPVSLHIFLPASKQLEASVARRRGQPAVGVKRVPQRCMEESCCFTVSHRDPQRERNFTVFNTRCIYSSSTSTRCNIANSPTCGTFLVFSWPFNTYCPGHTALSGWRWGRGRMQQPSSGNAVWWLRLRTLGRVHYESHWAFWGTRHGTHGHFCLNLKD